MTMPKVIDHEVRRREVADAAWRIIAQHGLDGLTLREVGRSMGRSTTAVTHYFPDREALIVAVAHQVITGWQRDFDELTANRDAETAIGLGALWALQYGEVERAHSRAFLSMVDVAATLPTVRDDLDNWDRWLIARTVSDMDEWMKSLKMQPPVDASTAARLLHHFCLGLTLSGSYTSEPDLHARQVEMLREFFVGIGLPVPRPVAEHESWVAIYASGGLAPLGEIQLNVARLADLE